MRRADVRAQDSEIGRDLPVQQAQFAQLAPVQRFQTSVLHAVH